MMRDQNFELRNRKGAKRGLDGFDLLKRNPPIFPGGGSRGIDAQHNELLMLKPRSQVVGDIALIPRKRRDKPRYEIVKGDVMIAGNNELGKGNLVEVSASRFKLAAPGALSKVAAVDDQCRLNLREVFQQTRSNSLVLRAEVKIGNVRDDGHLAIARRQHDVQRFRENAKMQWRRKAANFAVDGHADLSSRRIDPELGGAQFIKITILPQPADQCAERKAEHAEAAGAVGEIKRKIAAFEAGALPDVQPVDVILVIADKHKRRSSNPVLPVYIHANPHNRKSPKNHDDRFQHRIPFAMPKSLAEFIAMPNDMRVEADAGIIDEGAVVDLREVDRAWLARNDNTSGSAKVERQTQILSEMIERAHGEHAHDRARANKSSGDGALRTIATGGGDDSVMVGLTGELLRGGSELVALRMLNLNGRAVGCKRIAHRLFIFVCGVVRGDSRCGVKKHDDLHPPESVRENLEYRSGEKPGAKVIVTQVDF